MKFALAQKLEMTRVFDTEGRAFPATKLALLPVKVSSVLSADKVGYDAVQVEIARADDKKVKKVFKTEFRVHDPKEYKLGEMVSYDGINSGDIVTLAGRGKGKGFSGVIKRHGFSRGPMGHGSNHHRAPGSIGGGYPQRVVAGRKMPGRLGAKNVTLSNMQVLDIDVKSNILIIKGSVPGPRDTKIKMIVTKMNEVSESVEEQNET